ncbi:acid protease [Auricularia subglabra TFB-10046 SS5]|nr:acid protease [Auricularia subglabra TFB-10046 SS5]
MGLFPAFVLLFFAATACRGASDIGVPSNDPSVSYQPADGWAGIGAPGAYGGTAQFLLSNDDQGVVTFKFPFKSSVFEFWGYERSDGGKYSLTIDGGDSVVVNYDNPSSTGDDPPKKLYSRDDLSDDVHTIAITNLLDDRVGRFGQMNIDHFVLNGVPAPPTAPTFPAGSWIAEAPLEFSYHVRISLGADSPLNGGSGDTVNVLFDTGATGTWVIWDGCTQQQCQGHSTYKESSGNFANTTKTDIAVYGDGGPANTLGSWRISDTVTLGNATIPSSTFGACYQVPEGGEGLDGNFGMGKSYCNGNLCGVYPSFVENMFDQGIISAPVLAFYQLAPNDQPADGVKSVTQVGGIDRNKFKGSMDWVPLTTSSQWQIPNAQRWVTDGSGNTVDGTPQFTHTTMALDTGDPGLLGLPTNDWNTLVQLAGAKSDSGNGWRFPCSSTMTWNFHGTETRNYTFALADIGTDDGSGFCNALANDAGDTTNWITGAPFLDQYYVAWYFGNKGVGSTMGFAEKNLDASASTVSPVVGRSGDNGLLRTLHRYLTAPMAPSIIEASRVKLVRESDGVKVYTGALHPEITIGVVPFGGYLLSVIIAACEEAVKDTPLRDAIHLTAYFLKSCEVGDCEVHVKFQRSGKAFHNIEAQLLQKGQTRLTAHLIFGVLSPAYNDPKVAPPPLTLTPHSPLYRRTPIRVHPSEGEPFVFREAITLRDTVRSCPDTRYSQRNKTKIATPNDGQNPDMNGIAEYGALLQFTHEKDELTPVMIPIVADLFRSTPELLRAHLNGPKTINWYPTMVLSIEFKHRIPRGSSYARNMAALYSQGRFLTEGRHDVTVEVWSAPPGTIGDRSAPVEKGWQDKMVCLAVATQMALTMSGDANLRRGKPAKL